MNKRGFSVFLVACVITMSLNSPIRSYANEYDYDVITDNVSSNDSSVDNMDISLEKYTEVPVESSSALDEEENEFLYDNNNEAVYTDEEGIDEVNTESKAGVVSQEEVAESIDDEIVGDRITLFNKSNDQFEYSLTSGWAYIEKYIGSSNTVVIPDTIEGRKVVSIEWKAFKNRDDITYVRIPESVFNIGMEAFSGCSSLKEIDIPSAVTVISSETFSGCHDLETVVLHTGLKRIESSAFAWCESLVSIDIPDSVTSIGYRAFDCCKNLKSVDLPTTMDDIGDYAFQACSSLEAVVLPSNLTSIGSCTFASCTSLTSIRVPDSVTSVGNCAFSGCSNLNSVTLSSSLSIIGYRAFEKCKKLVSIRIPDSVTIIGYSAFEGCDNLNLVILPNELEVVSEQMFSDCTSIPSITIPEKVTTIYDSAFSGCKSLQSVTIPNSVTSIGSGAFFHCDAISSITIPDSVTSIGSSAFGYCEGLSSITLPDSLQVIDERTFDNCKSLNSPDMIPDAVTTIKSCAFSYCTGLTSIIIPDSVTSIEGWAFDACSNLKEVKISKGMQTIDSKILRRCDSLKMLYIPLSITRIDDFADYNFDLRLSDVYYEGTQAEFESIVKVSQVKDRYFRNATIHYNCKLWDSTEQKTGKCGNNLKWRYGNHTLTITGTGPMDDYSATVDSGAVSELTAPWAEFIDDMDKLVVEEGVTSIGDYAFAGCKFGADMTFPSTLNKIGDYAFYHLTGGTTPFELPASITEIGEYSFAYCMDFAGYLRIPESLMNIPEGAFYGDYKLTYVILPAVTVIRDNAFSNCLGIWDVLYPDTEDNKNSNIIISENGNSALLGANWHYLIPADLQLVATIKEYVSGQDADYDAIINHQLNMASNANDKIVAQAMNRFFANEMFAADRGIKSTRNCNNAYRAYKYLTTDRAFLAGNFEWVTYNSGNGYWTQAGMGLGSVFNDLTSSSYDPRAPHGVETASIKNYKELLLDFIKEDKEYYYTFVFSERASDLLRNMGVSADNSIITMPEYGAEASLKDTINSANNAIARGFDLIKRVDLIKQQEDIEEGKEATPITCEYPEISKAVGNANKVFSFVADSAEILQDLTELEARLETIEHYRGFLTEIANESTSCMLPDDLKIAASILLADLENNYRTIYLDAQNLVCKKLGEALSSATFTILGPYGASIKSIISEIKKVDSKYGFSSFSKQAYATIAYSKMANFYSLLLLGDFVDFRSERTVDNAWKFYNDYQILFRLRYYGERAYLKMANGTKIGGWAASDGVRNKEEYVQNEFDFMNRFCRIGLKIATEMGEQVLYSQKATIACPVNVDVCDSAGNILCTILDGVEYDETNEYGRFICHYFPDTDEYEKLICLNSGDDYVLRMTGTDVGNVKVEHITSSMASSVIKSGLPVRPDDTLEFSTSNESYVLKSGEDDSVIEEGFLAVPDLNTSTTITLEKKYLALKPGEKAVVGAEVTPENAFSNLIWRSDNEAVASVKNGGITAVEEGKATITASYDDTYVSILVIVDEQGDVLSQDIEDPSSDNVPDDIWAALWSEDNTGVVRDLNYTFTGNAIQPSIHVYDGAHRLKMGTDYTLTYKNNKNKYVFTDEDYEKYLDLIDSGKSAKTKILAEDKKTVLFDPAKAPQIIIKMKGNYSGSQTVFFRIQPRSIDDEELFSATDLLAKYNKKKQTPAPVLKYKNTSLKYGTDFYVKEYSEAAKDTKAFIGNKEDVTEYTLTLVGKGNYSGQRTIKYSICGLTYVEDGLPIVMMNSLATIKIPDQFYQDEGDHAITLDKLKDGKGNPYALKVQYKGKSLTDGVDYVSSVTNNTGVGTATITLKGLEARDSETGYSFIGTKKLTFKIVGYPISKVTVSGINKGGYPYVGEAVNLDGLALNYKVNKTTIILLEEGKDFTVSYQKNDRAGTASVIFTGKDRFYGTRKATFKINPCSINIDEIIVDNELSCIYKKGGATPALTIRYKDTTLIQGKDYKTTYSNADKVYTDATFATKKAPAITITGIGNFAGKRTLKYLINQRSLTDDVSILASDKAESQKANAYATGITLSDLRTNKKLKAGTDYQSVANYSYCNQTTVTRKKGKQSSLVVCDAGTAVNKEDIIPAGTWIRVTVTGKGNYTDSISTTFKVLKNVGDIGKATFKITNPQFDGNAVNIMSMDQFEKDKSGNIQAYIKSGKTITYLNLGEDFEVVKGSYVNNSNAGKASVTFHGIGNYGGYKTVQFTIGTRSLTQFWKGLYERIRGLSS
ncbi:leucine-rich repeat protein [Butyrivibrio proteoclasticus]|uniref:leucine-rich repeat protein n=1 Tax=Butyrivibrio proteoclasticus TaxID=43305 RepID=UPI00054FC28E|nr:leucine-rich repeat protein [Butyrivibrio proteoclasticus]